MRILLFLYLFINISTVGKMKTHDYIRIDQEGERDKPIGPLVISKEKIPLAEYELYEIVSEEVFNQSTEFILTNCPKVRSEISTTEWGSFKITIVLNDKKFYCHTTSRKESIEFFTKWNSEISRQKKLNPLLMTLKGIF